MKRTYAITGASGRIGNRVARGLLEAGHSVRAIGRDAGRLKSLVELGAEARVGDVAKRDFVVQAFEGVDAAYLLVSGDRTARDFRRSFARVGDNYANAAEATGLRKALFVSSMGAHDQKHRGLVLVHSDVESALDAVTGTDVLYLRAGAFFENLVYYLPATRARGALTSALDVDAPIDMVATADVAQVALARLLELDFRGKSALEVRGREPLTMRAVAERIARELGRLFGAERAPREAAIEAMVAAGMHRDFSTLMHDTWDTFSRYGLMRAPECAWTAGTTPIDTYLREAFIPALTKES
jgi:uncharacterized protein YbjT (DUF2867 family)